MTGAETLLFVAMSACDYAVPVAGGACCVWYALGGSNECYDEDRESQGDCAAGRGDGACPPRFQRDYWRCDRQRLPTEDRGRTAAPSAEEALFGEAPATEQQTPRPRVMTVGSITEISHADSSIA